jgi:VanZ family protein
MRADRLDPFEHQRLARLLFLAAAVFAFVMAVLPHPPNFPGEPSDKIQHMAAFATLAFLGSIAFPRVRWLQLVTGLSLFGAAIELAQAIPMLHRDSEFMDWVADTATSALVVLVMIRWRSRFPKPEKRPTD